MILCHGLSNIRSKKLCRNSSQSNLSTYAESRGTTLDRRRGGKQKQVEGAASRRRVRYFDVNNFRSALDRFWREKERGQIVDGVEWSGIERCDHLYYPQRDQRATSAISLHIAIGAGPPSHLVEIP